MPLTLLTMAMEHTNETQVDFPWTRTAHRAAQLKGKMVTLKAKDIAVVNPMEQDMHTEITEEASDMNEPEQDIAYIEFRCE